MSKHIVPRHETEYLKDSQADVRPEHELYQEYDV